MALYAPVAVWLLTVEDERFSNTHEANYFMVQGISFNLDAWSEWWCCCARPMIRRYPTGSAGGPAADVPLRSARDANERSASKLSSLYTTDVMCYFFTSSISGAVGKNLPVGQVI